MSFILKRCVLGSSRLKVLPQTLSRSLNTGSKTSRKVSLGLCTAGASLFGGAIWWKSNVRDANLSDYFPKSLFGSVVAEKKKCSPPVPAPCKRKCPAKSCLEHQPNVTSSNRTHCLYLWITLDSCADRCAVARVAADIDALLASVVDPDEQCPEEIIAGVGFGSSFYSHVMGKPCKNYNYASRKCSLGELPNSDGDIFLHVKCNDKGKLFEVCKNYLYSFPESSIREYDDVYGFDYKCGKDVSNFYLNTTNPECPADIKKAAVECDSGGSYALALKWIHDFSVLRPENKETLEKYYGMTMEGDQLESRTESSHMTRIIGSAEPNACPTFQVVGHAMSYGSLSKGAGTFELDFAKDPEAFEFMLDRMVAASCDDVADDFFRMSKNVKGSYFYFPGLDDLNCLKKAG